MKATNFFKMDLDNGEGEFNISLEFKNENSLLKLDIMKDWLVMLKEEYNNTLDEWQDEMKEIAKNNK